MNDRVDLFRNAHTGIRNMLCHLVQKAGRTDFTDEVALESLKTDAKDVFGLIELHAHTEETHIMPLAREVAPDIAQDFDRAHAEQDEQLRGLRAALARITNGADVAQQGHRFVLRLSRFAGEQLMHMADEQLDLNPALWSHATDAALAAVQRSIAGSLSPVEMQRNLRWMVPAMNPRERDAFTAMLPPPVREIVATLA